ncbi:VWA domain-containing protein [bacterium]|nr:VWA domain-containing protein [bacterium]
MKKQIFILLIGFILPVCLIADGFIVPEPGMNMAVKYHHVTVTIQNQVAHTQIDQVFLNDTDMDDIEAIYVFPLPVGATFTNFIMYVDGEPMEAEVLDADSARNYYESIVRANLDPALLEYIGTNTFRARLWPIGAHGERRVQISYDEILDYDNGFIRYLYPLNTEKFSSKPLESVKIEVDLSSPDPLKSVYSPSHTITTQKTDDYHAQITYQDENVTPDSDFLLYYTVSPDEVGMHMLTYREAGNDGFYLLLAAPRVEIDSEEIINKRMIFVIDRSGSMAGEKIVQAREALKFCVHNLNEGDLFNIIDFDDQITVFESSPVEVETGIISTALAYIETLNARGGTNINEALLTGLNNMQEDTYSNMIIFLTDGQPTAGEVDESRILANILSANNKNSRIFVFGVGYNVNTHLLDQLSEQNNGVSVYVSPDENIEIAVSSFYEKISTPVLSDCKLDFGSIEVDEQFPETVPDLFKGSQLVQLGRYLNTGQETVTLSGTAGGNSQSFTCSGSFTDEDLTYDFIPRLWAIRKVGELLNIIRLEGENEALVEKLIALAKRYGIITPYTSFLITEDVAPSDNFYGIEDKSGGVAFDNAVNIGNWRNADNTQNTSATGVEYVGNKTFYMRDSTWIDAQYDSTLATNMIVFGSADYFTLMKENPELGDYFALGNNVQVTVQGTNYQVTSGTAGLQPPQPVPNDYYLYQNTPNPFNPSTQIRFVLPERSKITVKVCNTLGQQIRKLYRGEKPKGRYYVTWNGLDDRGIQAGSGVYFVTLITKNQVFTRKMILLR